MDYQTLELCRISLLLFSCMVFFPLPLPTGVPFRIVTQLRNAIDGASAVMWNSRRNLLAWTLVLGGIGGICNSPSELVREHFRAQGVAPFRHMGRSEKSLGDSSMVGFYVRQGFGTLLDGGPTRSRNVFEERYLYTRDEHQAMDNISGLPKWLSSSLRLEKRLRMSANMKPI